MDLATGEFITCCRADKFVMTRMVIERVEQLATQQGYRSLKFFNRNRQEMILDNIDLLTGLERVSADHVVEGDELGLPLGNSEPGGLLSEDGNVEDVELNVDDNIDPSEIADLVEDNILHITILRQQSAGLGITQR